METWPGGELWIEIVSTMGMKPVPTIPSASPLLPGWYIQVFVTQLCLILCDPMDCSPPGSSVYGILQARILEWVAISFYEGSS